MRSHQEIVAEFGASKIAKALKERGHEIADSTPQRWADRDRVPAEWWPELAVIGVATLVELSATARPRKRRADTHAGTPA